MKNFFNNEINSKKVKVKYVGDKITKKDYFVKGEIYDAEISDNFVLKSWIKIKNAKGLYNRDWFEII